MLGDTLLVAPVMEEGKRDVEVYFPGGDKYFRLDYHETPAYSGNAVVSAGEDEQIPGEHRRSAFRMILTMIFSFPKSRTNLCVERTNQKIINAHGKRPDYIEHCAG